jgi:hypothetical protein
MLSLEISLEVHPPALPTDIGDAAFRQRKQRGRGVSAKWPLLNPLRMGHI